MLDWFKRWRRRDRDIQDELDYHVDMLTRDHVERGSEEEEARFAARRKLGNVTRAKENTRAVWIAPVMEDFLQDVTYTFRSFRKAPGFFAAVIGILALGIAASVSIFSLVDGILLQPLPYQDPQRIVMLTSYAPRPPFDSNGSVSYNDFLQFKRKSQSFVNLAITFRNGWSRATLTSGYEARQVQGAFVSANLFALAGRTPILGRMFTDEEDRRSERVAVISESLWREQFAGSPDVLGRNLEIGHVPWQIIGVAPADFQLPFPATKLWAPLHSHPGWNSTEETNPFDRARWDVLGRLKPSISVATAQSEINSIWAGLRSALPEFHTNDVRIELLREHISGRMREPLWLLFGAVIFLLLIACANVGNLLLARSAQRARELGVRAALGAGQGRLVRQLVTEAVTFSLVAASLGALLATQFVPLLISLAPANTPLVEAVKLNGSGLLLAFVSSIVIGIALGVTPMLQLSRRDVNNHLKGAGRSLTEGRGERRLRNLLVAGEFALAMILLTGAGLLVRSFIAVLNVNLGFRPQNILTVQFNIPETHSSGQLSQIYDDIMQRTAEIPNVLAVGGTSNLFYLDEQRTHALRIVEGRPPEPKSAWTPLVWIQIAGDYFHAMGIPLTEGRSFGKEDRSDSPLVAIVNQTLARRYWPGKDPIGKRFKGFDPRGKHDDWLTVIGVVGDVRVGGLERPPFSQVYELKSQEPDEVLSNLVVRTTGDPVALGMVVRSMMRSVDPNIVIGSIKSMEALVGQQEIQRRFQTWLISVFSAIALFLAALGIFAVMHYSVAARTSEIGIRMALGARTADISFLMFGGGARLALYGIVAGAFAALWFTRAIAGFLYGVKPTDPLSFGSAAFVLFAAAMLGSFLPANRASHIDPVNALRQE